MPGLLARLADVGEKRARGHAPCICAYNLQLVLWLVLCPVAIYASHRASLSEIASVPS